MKLTQLHQTPASLLFAAMIGLTLCVSGCATSSGPGANDDAENKATQTQQDKKAPDGPASHPNLNATLWVQSAAEYRALTASVWRQAILRVKQALKDDTWTAALEQSGADNISELPPAVIVDVDETVLDNSAFQARLVKNNEEFSTETWRKWCRETSATPVPGALSFAKFAAAKGVTVFYVTNRGHEVESATRRNLNKHGFPLFGDKDVILTQGERDGWTSDKTSRREFVAQSHRILLLAGDNLGDFIGGKDISAKMRIDKAHKHREKWGKKWIVLPNPTYGDWEAASYGYDYDLPSDKKRKQKLRRLETRSSNSGDSEDSQ